MSPHLQPAHLRTWTNTKQLGMYGRHVTVLMRHEVEEAVDQIEALRGHLLHLIADLPYNRNAIAARAYLNQTCGHAWVDQALAVADREHAAAIANEFSTELLLHLIGDSEGGLP